MNTRSYFIKQKNFINWKIKKEKNQDFSGEKATFTAVFVAKKAIKLKNIVLNSILSSIFFRVLGYVAFFFWGGGTDYSCLKTI